jgi:hypothetical protein
MMLQCFVDKMILLSFRRWIASIYVFKELTYRISLVNSGVVSHSVITFLIG